VVSNSVERNLCEVYRTFFMLANVSYITEQSQLQLQTVQGSLNHVSLYNR